jgi:hypothetical protein
VAVSCRSLSSSSRTTRSACSTSRGRPVTAVPTTAPRRAFLLVDHVGLVRMRVPLHSIHLSRRCVVVHSSGIRTHASTYFRCDERFIGYGGNKAACLFELYRTTASLPSCRSRRARTNACTPALDTPLQALRRSYHSSGIRTHASTYFRCDERFIGYGGNKAACLFELDHVGLVRMRVPLHSIHLSRRCVVVPGVVGTAVTGP